MAGALKARRRCPGRCGPGGWSVVPGQTHPRVGGSAPSSAATEVGVADALQSPLLSAAAVLHAVPEDKTPVSLIPGQSLSPSCPTSSGSVARSRIPPPHTHAASPSRPELPETERLPSPGPETPQGWQQLQLFPQSLPQRWTRPPQFCTISQWGDAPPFGQPLESIRRNRREGGREELAPSRPCRCQGSRGVARRVLVWSRSPTAPQGPGGLERGHSVPELPP